MGGERRILRLPKLAENGKNYFFQNSQYSWYFKVRIVESPTPANPKNCKNARLTIINRLQISSSVLLFASWASSADSSPNSKAINGRHTTEVKFNRYRSSALVACNQGKSSQFYNGNKWLVNHSPNSRGGGGGGCPLTPTSAHSLFLQQIF